MRRLALLVLLAVSLMVAAAVPASATNSWGEYHWARSSNPVTLPIVDSMTSAWDSYLGTGDPGQNTVSGDWTDSSVLDTPVQPGDTSNSTRKRCKPIAGKIRACNAAYGFNGWLGLAQIWISSGHIVKGTAKVNDSYFNTSTYNNAHAKRHVLCQEVGHDLGLDHQPAGSSSCMNDKDKLFDPAAVSPNTHDYEQLETIYNGHTDSASSTSASASGKGKGRDGAVVTFVVWAD